jgi:microsomal dipeptidase-like Zn-dependent dipeptidase
MSVAAAQSITNPTPSPTSCPDGTARIQWQYPFSGGIPGNATPVACDAPGGCTAFPASACLQLVEKDQSLNKPDIPPVKGDSPKPPAEVPPPPAVPPTPSSLRPTVPTDDTPILKTPKLHCVPDTGWDFEDLVEDGKFAASYATLQNWKGDGLEGSPFTDIQKGHLDLKAAPVYGNGAPIDHIRPPGWRPEIESQIGGDYWKFSQSVNAHGDFWISSLYRRYSWRQHPGDTWGENAVGTLTSPACKLEADFLTFRMSGGQSTSQRVELQVRGGDTKDYFGIRFPASLGDKTAGAAFGHGTQFPSVPTVPQTFPPSTAGWPVLRSVTSQDLGETDWMQVYVFDVRQFRGREVRIRVVDDARSQCVLFEGGVCKRMGQEHINADDFRFTDAAPAGTTWLLYDEHGCGFAGGPRDECSPVGYVISEPPLWGVTDAHAHPMANLAFGGHVIWGDPSDKLEDVYDCTRNLPKISGGGARDAITEPASSSACYVSGDIDVIVSSAVLAGCSQLAVVPVIGVGLAGVCSLTIAGAEAALLTTPLIEGLRLHGARKMASGAVSIGPILSASWLWALRLLADPGDYSLSFSAGLMPQFDGWSNAKPTLNWYDPKEDWHSFTGLAKSHNMYQVDMIRRAFQGGMRLGVWDVINSRALAFVADGVTYSDWQALKDGTDAAKRIVANNLSDIATIAYTPVEAERIIRAGRMAIVLGSEVDELGRMRPDGLPWPRSPHTKGDSMQKQISDLWELGIRKITPVHSSNNPIGGPAIFTEQYASNNHFLNSTNVDGDPSVFDLPAARFILDRVAIPTLPFQLILGDFKIFQDVGSNSPPPWNPDGWFNFDIRKPAADGIVITDDKNEMDKVTYRLGEGKPKNGALRDKTTKNWLMPPNVLGKQILIATKIGPTMSTFIRPIGRCDLHNTVMPRFADSFGDKVNNEYVTADGCSAVTPRPCGHRNALGLRVDGAAFMRAAMRRGMLLDVDHMSQNMRIDAYALAANYAAEARKNVSKLCSDILLPCGDYPFMGVHTTVRGLEKEGSSLEELAMQYGSNNESTRTPSEIDHVIANFGTIGVFPRGSAFIPPNAQGGRCRRETDCARWSPAPIFGEGIACVLTGGVLGTCSVSSTDGLLPRDFDLPPEVTNDCDTSSKTFAVKYLWMMNRTNGHGLTLTTDMNGFIGTVNPRFGGATPGKEVCGGKRSVLDRFVPWGGWKVILPEMQKQEHSGVWYADYTAKATSSDRAKKWKDPRWRQVTARGKSEVREDFAPRYQIDELVYFNDHGPDLPIHRWYDQNGNVHGAQMYPMNRWRLRQSGWDFNLDGFQHIGLLPDLIQDMRNVGVQWEQLGPMFHGARDFIDMWKRSASIAAAHR